MDGSWVDVFDAEDSTVAYNYDASGNLVIFTCEEEAGAYAYYYNFDETTGEWTERYTGYGVYADVRGPKPSNAPAVIVPSPSLAG